MPSDPVPPNNPNPAGKPRRRPAPGLGGNWLVVLIILFVVLLLWWGSTMSSPSSLTWGDFTALINHKDAEDHNDAYKYLRNITFVGTSTITGQVDTVKLPPDLQYLAAEKLKTGHFTVHRLQVNQDKELQDRLDAIQLQSIKDAAAKPREANTPPPAPDFHWDQQDEPFSGLMGTVVMFILPLVVIGALFFFLLPRFRDPLGGGFLSNYIKSPAKRYERSRRRASPSTTWPACRTPRANCKKSSSSCATRRSSSGSAPSCPRACCWSARPAPARRCWPRPWPARRACRSSASAARNSSRCSSASAPAGSATCSRPPRKTPPAILFIDEIDAVGRMRGAGVGGGSDEREQTLNQILSEMDGFTPTESVIVMAATNRPDVLDSALLRPGRFDRHITIDRPTWQGRLAILKVHTRNKPLADDVNLEEIARGMIGMTGADLRNLANEAALLATREGKNTHRPRTTSTAPPTAC